MMLGAIRRDPSLRWGMVGRAGSRHRYRPGGPEPLEQRVVLNGSPTSMTMLNATALSPQMVKASYQVDGTPAGSAWLKISRSLTASFPGEAVEVGQVSLQPSDLTLGTHEIEVPLTQTLDINPSMPYVRATVEYTYGGPGPHVLILLGSTTTFRIWTVGAVTHGYQPAGQFPSWVQSTADALTTAGYDAAVAFDWAALSALPAPGSIPLAAQQMTAAVNQTIAGLGVATGDVVDVQLIGHSRGGSVASLAAGLLDRSAPPLAGGYLKLTLLDPHPARNGSVASYSASNGPVGALTNAEYLAFQAAANDPPLVIPPGVDRTEIFYQQAPVTAALLPDEHFLMSWGAVPAGGATDGVVYYDMTSSVPSHEGLHEFYRQQVIPLLATGAPLPFPTSPAPVAPTTGGPAFPTPQIGTRYEYALFRSSGVPAAVTSHLLRSYSRLNVSLQRQRFGMAGAQITRINGFLAAQSGRGLPAFAARYLQGQLALARVLLLPGLTPAARALARAGR